jgi:hypothetical protein
VVHALVKKSKVCEAYNTNGRMLSAYVTLAKKNVNVRDELGDLGAYGKIILIRILMK